MADLKKQCVCVNFRLGKTASKMYEMLKTAFSDKAMERTPTVEWFSQFKRGETMVIDSEHSGHP
jgi:hypothetical protein